MRAILDVNVNKTSGNDTYSFISYLENRQITVGGKTVTTEIINIAALNFFET